MGRYTLGCEFHRYISGVGHDSGRSSAVTSYWFWAFGWMSGFVAAMAASYKGYGTGGGLYPVERHPLPYSPSARFQISTTAMRSAQNSDSGTIGSAPARERWCVRVR